MDEGGETPKVLAETPEEKLNEFLARIRRLSEGHQDPVDPTKLNPEKLEAELGNKLTAVATDLRNDEKGAKKGIKGIFTGLMSREEFVHRSLDGLYKAHGEMATQKGWNFEDRLRKMAVEEGDIDSKLVDSWKPSGEPANAQSTEPQ
ncbi:MAG: hypothetical protein UV56_C0028G0003 [Candidatus Woesebacteria bacterium GW2011_GWC1_43_10b]|uniref:Uncharacterized protein n=1 Tax=Candidatus Woesebacteria bacterium GW2011_GWC1_43_10b TaxID=1618585 RepID=A0A0G1C335_9BACT|nr:MAG: hypothetical protein UV56_C0028G0003 [Candidatus Woesebacteria bacterium GW2011_GWC1_43_10b]